MGVSTAYNLAKASDAKVEVIDRYGVGNEYCSSKDANRVFRYAYGGDRLYTQMAVESLKHWKQIERESGQELLIQTGLLLLHGDDEKANGFNEASYKTLSQMKLGAERLDEPELKKRFPQFRSDEAIIDSHGGVLLASKCLHTLQSLAEKRGVKFRTGQTRRIVHGKSPYVETSNNEKAEFRKLIITAGAWSNSLLNGSQTRIRPTRQQLIYLQPSRIDNFRPRSCPVFFTDKHYGLPAAGIDAVKVSPKELTLEVDPDTANRSVDEEQITECRAACRKFVPELAEGNVVGTKVCLYDMTENSDFVLDHDPDHSDLIYGYGFSGHGFKFAPMIGKLLAELALDQKPSFDLERFSAVPSRRVGSSHGSHLGKGE